ncbi:MAG: hypothetical protein GEU80_10630 [Dehalococcoidia bacterium]|nr:hypothetical protein [Dehalococcoidia bacterium]
MASIPNLAGSPRTRALAPAADALGLGHLLRRVSSFLVLALVLLAVGALGLFQVLQSSRLAEAGYGIRGLESERTRLQSEIRLLEAGVAGSSNLEHVHTEAVERLGMVEPEQSVHVSVGVPAPGAVPLPRRYVREADPPPPAAEPAWWESLLRRLPGFE